MRLAAPTLGKRAFIRAIWVVMALAVVPLAANAYTFAGDDALVSAYGTVYVTGYVTDDDAITEVAQPATVEQTSATSISVPISFEPYFTTTVPGTVSGTHVTLDQFLAGPIGPITVNGLSVQLRNITAHFEGDVTRIDSSTDGAYGPMVEEVTGLPSPTSYLTIADYDVKLLGFWVRSGQVSVDISAWNMRRAMPIGETRTLADGAGVSFNQAVVTAVLGDSFWVESADRSAGIRVDKPGNSIVADSGVDFEGALRTDATGERYVLAQGAVDDGSGTVAALGLTNLAIGGGVLDYQCGVSGGSGLNNIGFLARTWGKVTGVDAASPPTWFKIDDGSGVGVKCVVPSDVTISRAWQYTSVTGICSCEKSGAKVSRLLRVRAQSDIIPF